MRTAGFEPACARFQAGRLCQFAYVRESECDPGGCRATGFAGVAFFSGTAQPTPSVNLRIGTSFSNKLPVPFKIGEPPQLNTGFLRMRLVLEVVRKPFIEYMTDPASVEARADHYFSGRLPFVLARGKEFVDSIAMGWASAADRSCAPSRSYLSGRSGRHALQSHNQFGRDRRIVRDEFANLLNCVNASLVTSDHVIEGSS